MYDCYLKGGHVASIHSNAERDFLNELKSNGYYYDAWIGLQKNIVTNKYEWNDGSPLNYQLFGPNFKSEKNCVSMNYNTWTDDDCTYKKKPYYCQRAASNLIRTLQWMIDLREIT